MIEEPALPRRGRGAALAELSREDLDLYAVEELDERLDGLGEEIERTRRARDRKQASKSAADSVFSLGGKAG